MSKEIKDLDDLLDDEEEDDEVLEVNDNTVEERGEKQKDVDEINEGSDKKDSSKQKNESEDERLKVLRQHMNKVFLKNHELEQEEKEKEEEEENKLKIPKDIVDGESGIDDIFKDLNMDDINVDTDNIENMLSSFITKMLHKDVLYPTLKEMLVSKKDGDEPLKTEKEEIVQLICDIYEEEDYSDSNADQMEKISVLVDKLETMDSDFQERVNGNANGDNIDIEELTKNMNPEDCKMQ